MTAATVMLLVALVGCTGLTAPPEQTRSGSAPDDDISAFVTDWQAGRAQDASELTTNPAAAALLINTVTEDLGVTELAIETGTIHRTDADTADVSATMTWTLPIAGTWSYQVKWTWLRSGAGDASEWRLDYSPAIIHPDLGPQQTVSVRELPTTDGPIVDRNDVQLVSPVRVYSVVVLVDKISDVKGLATKLAAVLKPAADRLTASSITAGMREAKRADRASYTVVNLREGDFTPIESQLAALPGTSFPSEMRDLPPSSEFATTLLSSALPVAQSKTKGESGWRIVTVDVVGDELQTLAEQAAIPGPKVALTLDPAAQNAAQQAIDPIEEPAVLVAIEPSTGEILAVAQNAPANSQGAIALTGNYPPGSTFKIVTATAAIDAGLIAPTTTLDCPGEWTTHHHTIHNEGFALGSVSATTAFAHSCNTTFAQLAAQMPDVALPDAAKQYGIGLDFDIAGITTLTGAIQEGDTVLARAENGFGQGTDLMTPFSAALMAATAATGDLPIPILIRGTTTKVDEAAPPRSADVRSDLRAMMRAVVTDGTAKVLAADGKVYAKTGTAEYVNAEGDIQAHAWTVGFRDDVAFSVLIVGGDSSTRTNDIAHTFLGALSDD